MDVDKIRAVAREVFLEEMGKLRGYALIRDARAKACATALPQMAPRHIEVADLLVLGWTNKEIGRRLNIAEGTVKIHVSKIMQVLGAGNRTHAALIWHARLAETAMVLEAAT